MQTDTFFLIGFLLLALFQFYVLMLSLFTQTVKTLRKKMGELKIGLWLLQLSGFGCWIWGIIDGWGDFKSISLFIVAIIFAGYKIGNAHLDFIRKRNDFRDYEDERKSKKMNKKLNDTGDYK
jgi:hypothetical protein